MKKKVIKKAAAEKAVEASTPENAEDLRKIMLRMAKQAKMDEPTFKLLLSTGDAQIQTVLKNNKSLTKEQKRQLGIVEVPFIDTAEWRKLPPNEAKQHLLEALTAASKNWSISQTSHVVLHKFICGQTSGMRDLQFTKQETQQILEICRKYLDKNTIKYSDFVRTILKPKGWNLQFDAKMISESIIVNSTYFIKLIDILPKESQIEVIENLSKAPMNIKIYIAFIDYCFPGLNIWDEANPTLRLGYYGCKERIHDLPNKTPEWTAEFLRKIRLSPKEQTTFDKIIKNVSLDPYDDDIDSEVPDEMIETAINSGMLFVKGYKAFDKWLLRKLKTPTPTSDSANPTISTSMSEQIAEWICSDADNANKVCEVVELAGLKSV